MSHVGIIGSGFSGLSSACFLAKEGFDVTVFEKNDTPGGRARKFESHGFTFDMGPSWYWMPDVFEKFFAHFDKKPSDFYNLLRLDPSYQVIFSANDIFTIPARLPALHNLFESIEPGSSVALSKFLNEAALKYEVAMNGLVFKPGLTISELMSFELLNSLLKVRVFESMSAHVRRYFKSSKLIQLLEFPVLFLGAKPERTPALYSLMNYADMKLGTWYPMGGMYMIVDAMVRLATSLGVKFCFNHSVTSITVDGNIVSGVVSNNNFTPLDYLVASGDYNHIEQHLLPESHRQYSASYWDKRVMAPSSLIYYVGTKSKVEGLLHHNLFFDSDFRQHAREIYDMPQWPTDPQFYVCCPSKTDSSVAPENGENIFILIPTATGLADDTEALRKTYFDMAVARMEKVTRSNIKSEIVFMRSYAHADFINDYNAFKGNAYGLANTLSQTANLKPSIVNKKLTNMFYTGQLTVPGPGVPPAIISGQVTSTQLIKAHRELITS